MPMRSSTRAAAALMSGESAGCTQPASASIFRACRGAGQAPVLNSRRAGRLASAAGEAAVEVQPRPVGDLLPLEHLLHEIDAASRAVVLVAEEQIGRTGRGAEAAVHALAEDRVGLAPFGRVADKLGQSGLHQRISVIARDTSGRG